MSQSPQPSTLDVQTTALFLEWTPQHMLTSFKGAHDKLSSLAHEFFEISFKGIKFRQRSIYLKNKEMIATLLGYDEWAKYIPTEHVGLHKKFKTNAGILAHILKRINLYKMDEEKLNNLNDEIQKNTAYDDLDDMLDCGKFIF